MWTTFCAQAQQPCVLHVTSLFGSWLCINILVLVWLPYTSSRFGWVSFLVGRVHVCQVQPMG